MAATIARLFFAVVISIAIVPVAFLAATPIILMIPIVRGESESEYWILVRKRYGKLLWAIIDWGTTFF